jgi:hypothetical protein
MKSEMLYRILFGVVLVLFFVLGMYIGVEISTKEEQTNIIAATNNDVKIEVEPYKETSTEDVNINDEDEVLDVSIKYNDIYPDCGHTIESEEEYWDTTVSIMKEEIANNDLGYRLIGEEEGLLIYQKVHNGKCLNHYKVILEDGSVKVYRINLAGEFEFYQDTEITTKTSREGIKEQLVNGIYVDEVEELLLLIEDIES